MLNIQKVTPGQLTTEYMKIFIYGKSFVGKTTFANTFPNDILLISTDGNYKTLPKEVYVQEIANESNHVLSNGAIQKISGWLVFKEAIAALGTSALDDIQTVIVDLIKDIYDMCREYVLRREGVKHESEIKAQGKSWTLIDQEFTPVLRELMNLKKNVVIIANENDRDGKFTPDTIDSLTKKIIKYSDLVGRFSKKLPQTGQSENGVRALSCTSDFRQESGNRYSINAIEIEEPTYDKLLQTIKNNQKQGE